MKQAQYEDYMREAIRLANKARFMTWPNPCVGAIIVKNNKIIGKGWHKNAGLPHAEIECLNNARENGHDPSGAELVVTLEPCNHFGKTPPCADAIINAGIKKVIYGTQDPNSEASGGLEKLKQNGIEVIGPILENQCKDLISDFTITKLQNRPYIILKLASTLDGKIATRTGHSKWISCELSRKKIHYLRAALAETGGAILIGGGTFRSDNPQLSARIDKETEAQPLACIMTSRLPRADADFYLLRNEPERTVFFASPAAAASTAAEALRKLGCRIYAIGPTYSGLPDFALMFNILKNDLHCPYVLCEGGGYLALSLMEAGYVDEFYLHLAPIILGDNDARPLFDGHNPLSLEDAIKMRFCDASLYGDDAHLVLRPLLYK